MRAHDLVVGGSGMLAGLCAAMARDNRMVSVVARGHGRLERLVASAPAGAINPLRVDYSALDRLGPVIESAIEKFGPIERAICWIHSDAPAIPLLIARHVRTLFCHVLGSASADPALPDPLVAWRTRFTADFPALEYRIIVLGFVAEGGHSRWLSNDEISAGVKHALDHGGTVSIVGSVTPWSARP